jgi:hypothetical protein
MYYRQHPKEIPGTAGEIVPEARKLAVAPSTASTYRGKVPVSPFAVPAVLEALSCSLTYGPLTRLVPDEADPYCAKFAREHGATILTSDSDLMVFNLGSKGKVLLFNDIDFTSTGLIGLVYEPARICFELSLPSSNGIMELAFATKLEDFSPLKIALAWRKRNLKDLPDSEEYQRFATQYSAAAREVPDLPQACHFDPRVSEVILQCVYSDALETLDVEDPVLDSRIFMFLPCLLDSGSRTSAWEISVPLRQMAYGLLKYVPGNQVTSIVELGRISSPTSNGRVLGLSTLQELERTLGEFASLVLDIKTALTGSNLRWTMLSMYLDLDWSKRVGRDSLVLHILQKETHEPEGTADTSSWNTIHWLAQIQGTLYSLRMLKQIANFVTKVVSQPPRIISRLENLLESLPLLSEFPSLQQIRHLPGQVRSVGGLGLLADLAGLAEPIRFKPHNLSAKKARKLKPVLQPAANAQAANPFSVLEMD